MVVVGVLVCLFLCACGREQGGWLARHSTSIRWARLIARTFGHGHRAVCSGDLFGVVVDVEVHVFVADFLVDDYL